MKNPKAMQDALILLSLVLNVITLCCVAVLFARHPSLGWAVWGVVISLLQAMTLWLWMKRHD